MQNDYLLVFGIIAILGSIPALLNAYSGGRSPGVWAVMLIAGFAMVAVVMTRNPSTYTVETIPDAFGRVIGSFLK